MNANKQSGHADHIVSKPNATAQAIGYAHAVKIEALAKLGVWSISPAHQSPTPDDVRLCVSKLCRWFYPRLSLPSNIASQ